MRVLVLSAYPKTAFLVGGTVGISKPVFVHDPVGLHTSRCLPRVEDQGLLDPKGLLAACARDRLVGAGCLPVPSPRSSVWPRPVGVLSVPRGEKIPFSLSE